MSAEILEVLLAAVMAVHLHETLHDILADDCHSAVSQFNRHGTFLK
jgi:hypothetical protein